MPANLDFMFQYFIEIRRKHPNIDRDLKAILRRSPQEAMCMADIKVAYRQRAEEPFPLECGSVGVGEFLLTIPYVACYCDKNGTLLFYTVEGI